MFERYDAPSLTLRTLFAAWFPLALSFELMVMEGPTLQGAMGRLPSPETNLAAWGLALSLAMLVESPVIMLLATSIALVRDKQSFRELWRFMAGMGIVCTLLAALLAFTPILDVLAGGIMRQPAPLITAARPALAILLFFTAGVGWRRFYQGILIRHDRGRFVTVGTALRILTIVGVAVALAASRHLSGIEVAAWGLMAGIFMEATVTTLFARPLVRDALPEATPDASPLTQRAIARFHAPLAATTLFTLLAGPMTGAALAHLPHPETTLAAWPVVFMILLILRGFGLTVQEATVAQVKGHPENAGKLYRFAVGIGLATSGAALLLVLTPLLGLYLGIVLRLPPDLWASVREGVLWGWLTPLLSALGAWARGVQVARNSTPSVYRAMLLSLLVQTGTLIVGALLHLSGMQTAALSFTAAFLTEFLTLRRAMEPAAVMRRVGAPTH